MDRLRCFAVFCLAALTVVAAQGAKGINHKQIHAGQEQQFKLLDADGNGAVTVAEVAEARRQLKERQAAGGNMAQFESTLLKKTEEHSWHKNADENSDGHLTIDEFKFKHPLAVNHNKIHAGQEQQFKLLDGDGNGAVTDAEVAEVRRQLKERQAAGEDIAQFESTLLKKTEEDSWHKDADDNSDGHLTMDEFKFKHPLSINHTQIHDRQEQQFQLMDADENGAVTVAEVAEVRRKLKEREAAGGSMEDFESTLLKKTEQDSWHKEADEDSDGHLTIDEFKFKAKGPGHLDL